MTSQINIIPAYLPAPTLTITSNYNSPMDLGKFIIRTSNGEYSQTTLENIFAYNHRNSCLMCATGISLLITPLWFTLPDGKRGAVVCVVCNACAISTGANLGTDIKMQEFLPNFYYDPDRKGTANNIVTAKMFYPTGVTLCGI